MTSWAPVAVLIIFGLLLWAVILFGLGLLRAQLQMIYLLQLKSIDKEFLTMTVQQIKDLIAAASVAIQAKVTSETQEVIVLISGNAGGATASQLDEIGAGITQLQSDTEAAIGSISDNAAGTPAPNPNPQP